jgi:rhodanese-related sulfurtransferase
MIAMPLSAEPVISRRISPRDAADMVMRYREGALPALAVFDVRDAGRFNAAHIPIAQHLTETSFPTLARKLPRHTPVLVYCYHGNASQQWAQTFIDFRFVEAWSVDGGYEAFAEALSARQAGRMDPPRASAPSAALSEFLDTHGFDPDDLDAPRDHGLTPLMRAALLGNVALATELIACGVSLDKRNMDGNTALWMACVSSKGELVRLLAEAGIDLDNRNDMGATSLMFCASAGKPELVALLLELGADALITNFDDLRAGDLAATRECLNLLRHTVK